MYDWIIYIYIYIVSYILYISFKFLFSPIGHLLMDKQHCTLTTMELSRHKLCTLKLCAVIRLGQPFEYCISSGKCIRLLVCCSYVTLNPGVWQLGIRYNSISMWVGNRFRGGVRFPSGAMIFWSLLLSCWLWSPRRVLYSEYRLLFSTVKTRRDTRVYLASTLWIRGAITPCHPTCLWHVGYLSGQI